MAILTVGIDLAKNVFALHGVNEVGKPELLQPRVPRAKLHALVAALPPCTIGIEACSGAHHWARLFQAHGHSVRLIAPKLVTPYRMSGKRGKNDAADAAATLAALSGRSSTLLSQSRLGLHDGRLVLTAVDGWSDMLLGEQTTRRATTLAGLLGLPLEVRRL